MNAPILIEDADLARADMYALLAHVLFAAPDAALLATLQQMAASAQASETDDDGMTTAWLELCDAAHDAQAVSDEFDALFVSVGKQPVAQFASWYLTGFLMEKPLALLRDDLNQLGLSRHGEQREPEDHIAGELEVMRHLIMRGDSAAQQQFFQRHLQSWYAAFCDALENADNTRFYRALARFMRAFLNMERDYFRLQAADGGMQ